MKAIIAVLRTSEFWAFLFQIVVEAVHAPVPEEFQMATWAYITFRIVSKVVKFIADQKKVPPAAIIFAILMLPCTAMAQDQPIPISSVVDRAHVTVNGGAMVLTAGDDWSGASLGAGVGYNFHPKFSIFYGYDHGFPINNVDSYLDFERIIGSVGILPNAFVGFGYGWFGNHVDGGLLQLAIAKPIATRLDLAATYSHVFADQTLDDFEYVKVCLNYHLLGKE